MKNGKIKLNKTKIVARVMLVVLLFSSALNLAGCGQEHKYMYTANHTGSNLIQSTAYSTNVEFDIDNISIDVSYGINKLNIFGEVKSNPKEQLSPTYKNSNFSLYAFICNCVDYPEEHPVQNTNCILFNYVCDEELFSKEYGYIDTPSFISNGVVYNHTDNIIIPEYMFDKDWGFVWIRLQLYVDFYDSEGFYLISEDSIRLRYKKTNNRISFSEYWIL